MVRFRREGNKKSADGHASRSDSSSDNGRKIPTYEFIFFQRDPESHRFLPFRSQNGDRYVKENNIRLTHTIINYD